MIMPLRRKVGVKYTKGVFWGERAMGNQDAKSQNIAIGVTFNTTRKLEMSYTGKSELYIFYGLSTAFWLI